MPTMKFTNDEIGTLLHALRTEAGEWLRYKTFHGSAQNIDSVSRILENVNALEDRVQEVYCNMTDEDDEETAVDTQITEAEAKRRTAVAKMIIAEIQVGETLNDGSIGPYLGGYPGEGMVWHHKHGWLHPVKYLEAAKADIEAGDLTREDVADALGVDLAEVDAENARDRGRQRCNIDGFYKHALQSVTENVTGEGMRPATWTTLPEGFDVAAEDTWPIDPILGSWTSRLDPANADRIDISFNGAPRYRAVVQKSISAAVVEDILQAAYASVARLGNE